MLEPKHFNNLNRMEETEKKKKKIKKIGQFASQQSPEKAAIGTQHYGQVNAARNKYYTS